MKLFLASSAVALAALVFAVRPGASSPTTAESPVVTQSAHSVDTQLQTKPASSPVSYAGTDTLLKLPLRYPSATARQQVADAVSAARASEAPLQRMTYDFSGEVLASEPGPAAPSEVEPGPLGKKSIRTSLAEVRQLIWECYEVSGARDAGEIGELAISFVVEAEPEIGGYVREIDLGETTTLHHSALSDCVTETILSLAFVPPAEGKEIAVVYRYDFQPESK